MSELRCCPFCGGEARNESCGNYWVKCTKCGSRGSVENTEKEAMNQWNTRTPMANIVEKLEEAEKKGSELMRKTHMDSHVLSGWGCAMKTAIEIVREEGAKNDRS